MDDDALRGNVEVFIERMNDVLMKLSEAIESDDLDAQRTALEAIVGNVDILKAALEEE